MKKIYLFFAIALFFLLTSHSGQAQNLTNYNLYMQNPVLYNPAFVKDGYKISAFLNNHTQWTGFDGAPKVNSFGLNACLKENMALGLLGLSSKQGITTSTTIYLNYGYRINMGTDQHLTFGLGLGLKMDKLEVGDITGTDLSDPEIIDNSFDNTTLATRFGMAYQYKAFEAQLAFPQLYESGKSNMYALGIFSYRWKVNEDFCVKPSLMMRGVKTSPMQFDLNALVAWKNTVWIQAGYRASNSIMLGVGVNVKGLEIGYAYQMDNSDAISAAAKNTHEIQLIFRMGTCERRQQNNNNNNTVIPNNNRRVIEKDKSYNLGSVNFETSTANLTSESKLVLDSLVIIMKEYPEFNVEIQGHTDDVGDATMNQQLSQKRAQSCADYVISKGIAAERVKPVGYGETVPLVPNDSDANRALNRRVEFKFTEN